MIDRPHRFVLAAVSSLALAACSMSGQDDETEAETAATADVESDYGYETYGDDNLADSMASNDARFVRSSAGAEGASGMGDSDADIPDPEDRPIMQAQVVLDRVGFGPGVIDGKMGMSTENALVGFQEANDLDTTGELDEATKQALAEWDRIPATRVVTIPTSWGEQRYYEIPDDPAAQAEMERLGYKSLDEKLAERFHTTVDVLRQLNPNGVPAGMDAPGGASTAAATNGNSPPTKRPGEGYFKPGQQVRVPNIGGDRIAPGSIDDRDWQRTLASLGVGTEQPEVDRIVVSKAGKTLKAYAGEKLVGLFTVSSGSSEYPLPLGEWDIVGEAYNPPFEYDPEVLSGDAGEDHTLPPGPNGPVGVVWIDLSKEHYGIHGTPEPETIGRAQSHGCVRLTNWDAARLAQMVSPSTRVIFEA
ncbi:L,D-transpeptidase family protein [Qipengyuania sp. MTN3-11]|uniref:L,D-transpeptidase family protein n=1 Tax=Qipengyuania sp. MTN3-11 TaxID=3056557 RepID=UPI0036F3E406